MISVLIILLTVKIHKSFIQKYNILFQLYSKLWIFNYNLVSMHVYSILNINANRINQNNFTKKWLHALNMCLQ